MGFMKFVPLLGLVVLAYNVLAYFFASILGSVLFTVRLPSGGIFAPNTGHVLVTVAVILLFAEIVKATWTAASSVIDHGLSLLVFVVALVEFLILPEMGSPVFFIITLITLLDVIAGFTVTLSASRRDMIVSGPMG